jgi:hypothetical protein
MKRLTHTGSPIPFRFIRAVGFALKELDKLYEMLDVYASEGDGAILAEQVEKIHDRLTAVMEKKAAG